VVEIAERAVKRWETVFTDFLSPPVAADAMAALAGVADLSAVCWGGYPQAERCRYSHGSCVAHMLLLLNPQRAPATAPQQPGCLHTGQAAAPACRIALGREEVLSAAQEDPSQLGGVAALQVRPRPPALLRRGRALRPARNSGRPECRAGRGPERCCRAAG
jgi:hypothetical protein